MSLIRKMKMGLQAVWSFKNVSFYVLLIQVLLSGLVALSSFKYVNASIGSSLNLQKIIQGYDHDVLQDLLRFEQTGWGMLKSLLVLVVIMYILLGPWIMGGILNAFHRKEDSWKSFWEGGSKYYFSFFKNNLFFLFILLLVLGLLATAAFFFSSWGLEYFLSEVPVLAFIFSMAFIFLVIGIGLVSASTRSKWFILNQDLKVGSAIRKSLRELRSHFFRFLMLGLLFLLLSLVLAYIMNGIINWIPESGLLLIFLAFVIQVIALYLRVCLRTGYYQALVSEE